MTDIVPVPEKWAILIGIDFYIDGSQRHDAHQNAIKPKNLKGCLSDVQRVEHYLLNSTGFTKDHIYKLTSSVTAGSKTLTEPMEPENEWPTRENIVRCFEEVTSKAKSGDFVYIHYSGHGSQSKTVYESLKGEHGRDEVIVPMDVSIGKPYLRDLEIAFLLDQMVKKALVITVVLDSCHSGSATRDEESDMAVREISAVNSSILPGDKTDCVPLALGLEALAHSVTFERRRGTEMQENWLLEPRGYVLLAACRSSEKAREYTDEYGVTNGVFTYWLIESLRSWGSGSGLTAMELHRLIYSAIRKSPKYMQTPVVGGESDRLFFGTEVIPTSHSLRIRAIDSQLGGEAIIEGGIAHGVFEDSEYTLHCAGVGQSGETLGTIRVTKVAALESAAVLIECQPATIQHIQPGCRAILSNLPMEKKFRVKLSNRCQENKTLGVGSGGNSGSDLTINPILHLRLLPADADDIASITWYIDIDDHNQYVLLQDTKQNVVPNIVPPLLPLPVSNDSSWEKLLARLSHLAQYRMFQEMKNQDPTTSLQNIVDFKCVEISKTSPQVPEPSQDLMDDRSQRRGSPANGRSIKVVENDYVKVCFKNKSKTTSVNLAIFNLNPLWGIKQVYPRYSAFETVEAQDSRAIAFKVHLSEELKRTGQPKYVESLKAFVTVGSTDYRSFELPDINKRETLTRSGGELSDFVSSITLPRRDIELVGSLQERSPGPALTKMQWDAIEIVIESTV